MWLLIEDTHRHGKRRNGLRAGLGWYGRTFNESEMARSSECTEQYAQKVFDNAGIVRDAILQQLSAQDLSNSRDARPTQTASRILHRGYIATLKIKMSGLLRSAT